MRMFPCDRVLLAITNPLTQKQYLHKILDKNSSFPEIQRVQNPSRIAKHDSQRAISLSECKELLLVPLSPQAFQINLNELFSVICSCKPCIQAEVAEATLRQRPVHQGRLPAARVPSERSTVSKAFSSKMGKRKKVHFPEILEILERQSPQECGKNKEKSRGSRELRDSR